MSQRKRMHCCHSRVTVVFARTTLLLLLITTLGCSRPGGKLIGKWRMEETEELHETMVGETVDELVEQLKTQGKEVTPESGFVASQLEIEFAADGRLLTTHMMMNKPYEKTGKWCFEKVEGSDMHYNFELSGDSEHAKVTFIDDDTIRMIPPNFHVLGKEHTFKRVK